MKTAEEIVEAEERKRSVIAKVSAFIADYFTVFLQILVVLGGLLPEVISNPSRLMVGIFIFVSIVALISISHDVRQRGKLSVVVDAYKRNELILADEKKALRETLRNMGNRLLRQQSLWSSEYRVSIYGYNESDGSLYLLARASHNPDLQKPGRQSYPGSQGYIGEVWRNGTFFRTFSGKSAARKYALNSGYSDEDLNKLSMLALGVAGLRLDDGVRQVGVLLFESLEKPGDSFSDLIQKVQDSPIVQDILDTVVASETIIEPISISMKN